MKVTYYIQYLLDENEQEYMIIDHCFGDPPIGMVATVSEKEYHRLLNKVLKHCKIQNGK